MKIGLVQYNPKWENKEINKNNLEAMLTASLYNNQLLIFPEMSLTGFTMQSSKFAEKLEGESFNFFANIAEKNKIDVIAGIIEEEKNKYYNTLIHINDSGNLINSYRKIHPFSYSTEDKYYSRGEKSVISNVKDFKTGLSICYDLRFPELFRYYGKERTELIVNIANWPDSRIEHWRALLKARAIENQCYVAGVNRVGKDLKLNYNGYSSVFDPLGNELITSFNEEKILSINIDKEKVEEVRKSLPFLDDIHLI